VPERLGRVVAIILQHQNIQLHPVAGNVLNSITLMSTWFSKSSTEIKTEYAVQLSKSGTLEQLPRATQQLVSGLRLATGGHRMWWLASSTSEATYLGYLRAVVAIFLTFGDVWPNNPLQSRRLGVAYKPATELALAALRYVSSQLQPRDDLFFIAQSAMTLCTTLIMTATEYTPGLVSVNLATVPEHANELMDAVSFRECALLGVVSKEGEGREGSKTVFAICLIDCDWLVCTLVCKMLGLAVSDVALRQ
jgi:hypothetical protein